jgi:hypothetical protein
MRQQMLDFNRHNNIPPPDAEAFNTLDECIQACDNWNSPIHSIRHIYKYQDKYYFFGHINCESCEHCDDIHAKGTRHAITIPTKFVDSKYVD